MRHSTGDGAVPVPSIARVFGLLNSEASTAPRGAPCRPLLRSSGSGSDSSATSTGASAASRSSVQGPSSARRKKVSTAGPVGQCRVPDTARRAAAAGAARDRLDRHAGRGAGARRLRGGYGEQERAAALIRPRGEPGAAHRARMKVRIMADGAAGGARAAYTAAEPLGKTGSAGKSRDCRQSRSVCILRLNSIRNPVQRSRRQSP